MSTHLALGPFPTLHLLNSCVHVMVHSLSSWPSQTTPCFLVREVGCKGIFNVGSASPWNVLWWYCAQYRSTTCHDHRWYYSACGNCKRDDLYLGNGAESKWHHVSLQMMCTETDAWSRTGEVTTVHKLAPSHLPWVLCPFVEHPCSLTGLHKAHQGNPCKACSGSVTMIIRRKMYESNERINYSASSLHTHIYKLQTMIQSMLVRQCIETNVPFWKPRWHKTQQLCNETPFSHQHRFDACPSWK